MAGEGQCKGPHDPIGEWVGHIVWIDCVNLLGNFKVGHNVADQHEECMILEDAAVEQDSCLDLGEVDSTLAA